MEKEIEEAAGKYINDDLELYESLVDGHISYNIGVDLLNKLFKAGANWQAERMYSEEEVLELLFEFSCNNDIDKKEMKEWFEHTFGKQFKKK